MSDLLVRANMMESRVLVVHAAQELSMMGAGYVWIATEWLAAAIDDDYGYGGDGSRRRGNMMGLIQGVLTLRQFTPESEAKRSLEARFKTAAGRRMNAYGLFAYDAVWAAARAIDAFLGDGGDISFSQDPSIRDANGSALRLSSLRALDQGDQLLRKVLLANFTGVTGRVRFVGNGGALADPAYEVFNVGGTGVRRVGYWSNATGGLLPTQQQQNATQQQQKQKLYSVVWPGDTTSAPRGWVFPNNGRPLRIGVPYRTTYRQFVSRDPSGGPDAFSGYCVDVFKAAVALLPYPVPVSFVLFGDGARNPSYGDLVQRVADGRFDAAVGDISIVTNRTRVVDFTQPYVESGLVIVSPVRARSSNEWTFLRPFMPAMWAITGAFFLFVGAVVWILEHRFNPEFRGSPRKQMVTIFWFSFSTMFFTHRENTVSTLGRFVLLIWLFVVLIINSSYTATLTSILTVQQLSTGIHDKWLSPGTCDAQSTDAVAADRLNLSSFWGLFLICGAACFLALLVYFARILCQFCKYKDGGEGAGCDQGGVFPAADPDRRSLRRPASIRDLMSFVDMEEAEVKRAIRSRSGERRLDTSMGAASSVSEGPSSSLSRRSSMSPV